MHIKNSHTSERGQAASNVLALIAAIIVIAIVIWGFVSLFRFAPSLPFWGDDDIEITVPEGTLSSGTPFPVQWDHEGNEEGSYALLYSCSDEYTFEIPTSNTESNEIPCGTSFAMPGTISALTLIPMLEETGTSEMTFTIVYMEDGEQEAEGSATVTVEKKAEDGNGAGTPPPSNNGGGSGYAPQPTGTPDLSVQILQIGVIDPFTGQLVPRSPAQMHELIAVRFVVRNIGTGRSNAWGFTANLPIHTNQVFHSERQQPLGPGDRIEYTLRFDRPLPGGGPFNVVVDPVNEVRELNEQNNSAQQFVPVF